MAKRIAYATILVAATVLYFLPAVTPVYSQGDITELTSDAFAPLQRAPAVFAHDEHNEKAGLEECYVCHHMDGKNPDPNDTSEGTPCADCHQVEPDDGTTSLLDAYHMQCKNCHEQKQKGPVACGECHVK